MQWKHTLQEFLGAAHRPLIVVLGPTASGKTDFSIRLAKKLLEQGKQADIINGDSRQLYRFLDIGTAKVTKTEQEGIPHHLFSVLDPKEEVTIADYQILAKKCIDEAHARGAVPIVVGGSMLYISAVVDGLQPLPKADPALRKKLEAEYEADGGRSLHARLKDIDPDTASSIHPHNKPYVVRAMEIAEMTNGAPSIQKKTAVSVNDILLFGLLWPRRTLVDRIEKRTPLLLKAGWVEEVAGLLERGYTEEDPGMKSYGYREIIQSLKRYGFPGPDSVERTKNDPVLLEEINRKTRQYAKRQMTWWKSDTRIHWIDGDSL